MKSERLQQILGRGRDLRLLVIGDLMLDEYVWGKVGRISPEAPVPVVQVSHESSFPGGAANVARNLREFSDQVGVVGLVGQDRHGEELLGLMNRGKIDTSACLTGTGFPTMVKTRIIGRQQQIVRVDREKIFTPSSEQIAEIIARVTRILPEVDAVIFEDYGKGLLTQALVDAIVAAARGKIIAADPNPRNKIAWHDFTIVKPNRAEAFEAAGFSLSDPAGDVEGDHALHEVGHTLQRIWNAELLLITLSDQGMILFQRNETPHHVPTKARQVFDVSGAGDTAIALFTFALAAGAAPLEAAEIANQASAVVVGKLGTATVNAQELTDSFAHG